MVIMRYLLLILIQFSCFSAAAQNGVARFLTEDGSDGRVMLPSFEDRDDRLKALLQLPIAFPAEEDSKGNWGMPLEGMQLSFRLEKYSYEVGEPIKALILLRNLSLQDASWRGTRGTEEDYTFFISQTNGSMVSRRKANPFVTDVSGHSIDVASRSQNAYWIDLDIAYDLTVPGTYQIYLARKVPRRIESGAVELRSSSATLTLLPAKDPAWTNRMPAEMKRRIELAEDYKRMRTDAEVTYPKPAAKPQPVERLFASKKEFAPAAVLEPAPAPVVAMASPKPDTVTKTAPTESNGLWWVIVGCLGGVGLVFLRASRRKS